MMQRLLILLLAFGVAGCMQLRNKQQAEGPDPERHAKNLRPGCYTVDLFDPYKIEYPAATVPGDARQFLGVWRQGGWAGEWCHDLYVTAVYPDGTADVLDLHGPFRKHGIEATVFKRKARIRDGVLTFNSVGYAKVSYRREGDYLLGHREGVHGKFDATLIREERIALVPIPIANPRRKRS